MVQLLWWYCTGDSQCWHSTTYSNSYSNRAMAVVQTYGWLSMLTFNYCTYNNGYSNRATAVVQTYEWLSMLTFNYCTYNNSYSNRATAVVQTYGWLLMLTINYNYNNSYSNRATAVVQTYGWLAMLTRCCPTATATEIFPFINITKIRQVESHRLNIEVDIQSLFRLHVTWCAQLYSMAETPQLPPSPRIWTRNTRPLLVSKDRRHLFVTPWVKLTKKMGH
jgi:hypothetical protein